VGAAKPAVLQRIKNAFGHIGSEVKKDG